MACSHDGSVDLARMIVEGAGLAGADAVQFQIWYAEDMVVPAHSALPLLREIELSTTEWHSLTEHSRDRFPGMEIIACVYDANGVNVALDLGVDALKLHAADLCNPALLRLVGGTGKRVDLSIGAASLGEIEAAVARLSEGGAPEIWLMYGFQRFPTPADAIDLRYMMALGRLFGLPVGYQDHADPETGAAYWLPAAAVGMGAAAVEKHITHDRSKKGVDHEAALNPDEFSKFVEMVRLVESAMGTGNPRQFTAEELEYRQYARKSLVLARDLEAGSCLTEVDLRVMRAQELGISPDRLDGLIGRKLRDRMVAFSPLAWNDVE
ncbi:MAG: N-acetylneuraminate synthase family protein [Thermoanaerobaculales bacterium]|nr:N-acetylneuraminate synthase family protein [Thermoanaerobaculales bacterium]